MSNYNNLISVIVPVYNVEKYLQRCVDSIVNQTYKNLEIFLVDDGSPDDCGAICDEYARKDKRIIVIHKENGGLSSARNAALDVAAGDYIMFVDSDDWVEPDFCMKALKMAIVHHVQIVAYGYQSFYMENGKTKKRYTNKPRLVDSSEAIRHLILRDDVIYNYAWNKIYERSLFENIRYPFGLLYEDNAVTYKLIARAKDIYVSDAILYNYVIRKDSISGVWFKPKAIADRFTIWKKRLEEIKSICPENEHIQILQIANEAIDGIWYLRREKTFNLIVNDMKRFLADNKKAILNEPNSMKFKIYYYARPLLPIMKTAGIIRDYFKKRLKF